MGPDPRINRKPTIELNARDLDSFWSDQAELHEVIQSRVGPNSNWLPVLDANARVGILRSDYFVSISIDAPPPVNTGYGKALAMRCGCGDVADYDHHDRICSGSRDSWIADWISGQRDDSAQRESVIIHGIMENNWVREVLENERVTVEDLLDCYREGSSYHATRKPVVEDKVAEEVTELLQNADKVRKPDRETEDVVYDWNDDDYARKWVGMTVAYRLFGRNAVGRFFAGFELPNVADMVVPHWLTFPGFETTAPTADTNVGGGFIKSALALLPLKSVRVRVPLLRGSEDTLAIEIAKFRRDACVNSFWGVLFRGGTLPLRYRISKPAELVAKLRMTMFGNKFDQAAVLGMKQSVRTWLAEHDLHKQSDEWQYQVTIAAITHALMPDVGAERFRKVLEYGPVREYIERSNAFWDGIWREGTSWGRMLRWWDNPSPAPYGWVKPDPR